MAYSPASSYESKKTTHRIWVKDGDYVVIMTTPDGPSISDPAQIVETTASMYRVVDEGSYGAQLIRSIIIYFT